MDTVTLLAGGFLAGVLGGMLGIGGGVVLMPLLRLGVGLPPEDAAGTCVLAVFFTSLGGAYRHHRLGNMQLGPLVPVIVAGATASVVASIAFPYITARGHWLDLGIGLVFVLVAVRMAFDGVHGLSRPEPRVSEPGAFRGTLAGKAAVGVAGGALPGLLGIGTGSVLVPAFTFLLRAPIKQAVAASLACFAITAGISAGFKLVQGFVDLWIAVPACIGTMLGANIGALINRSAPSPWLRLCCGALFGAIATRFVLLFVGGIP